MITIAFIGLLVFEGIVDNGGADAATLTVGPEQTYSTIGDAITAASMGDTIRVYAGTYNENVVINKKISLIGNGSANTTINGGGSGDVVNITANGVNIIGFTITNSSSTGYAGIIIFSSDYCKIENCRCLNNYNGIRLISSSWNKFLNNTCSLNIRFGFDLTSSSNNMIINNSCISNNDDGIYIEYSSNNILNGNNISNSIGDDGIHLHFTSNNIITNNTIKSNLNYGIVLNPSSSNTITNNTCLNNNAGILLFPSSNSNNIENNNCSSNIKICIYLHSSSNNIIINNNCSNSSQDDGIHLRYSSNSNTIINNICNSNKDKGIILYSSCTNNVIKNNTFNRNSDRGIRLYSSTKNMLINNTCTWNNEYGIYLDYSSSNIIRDNICCNSKNYHGINLDNSPNNIIINNSCNSNNISGLGIYSSNSNNIENNSCNLNYESGFCLYSSSKNTIVNNTCQSNIENGFYIYQSNNNLIKDNYCSNNSGFYDIGLVSSDSNTIKNNICQLSIRGLHIGGSDLNNIINNTCLNNFEGIRILDSDENYLINNNFSFNNLIGLHIYAGSNSNIIKNNNISNNNIGINMSGSGVSTNQNTFFENIISFNTNYGFLINTGGTNNRFFHNNIISNKNQAGGNSAGGNSWDNGYGEGNYWSDYMGFDNGLNDRILGDGIGDTLIPHLNLDNYPFTNRFGWVFPGIPILKVPGSIDSDGNYTISWNKTRGTLGYILEEDTSNTFDTPTEIFNGSDLVINLTNKSNDTYYYRIKAYNEYHESVWSNIVDIKVDLPPTPPTGLIALHTTGHEITLIWNSNPEQDVKGYHIYINDTGTDSSGPYHWVHSNIATFTTYTVTNLIEETIYYFKIVAFDEVPNNSTYSKWATATTLDVTPPLPPTGLKAIANSGSKIDLSWNPNIEPDLMGYIIFMNETNHGPMGSYKIIQILFGTNTSYIVTGLSEETKYNFKLKAFDEVPNNSSFSNIASAVTLDETPPNAPTGLSVSNPTFNSLTLSWDANSELDVIGYILYRSLSLSGSYIAINSEPISENQNLDTGLKENTTYYYKIKAMDDANLTSKFSNVAFGTTKQGPYPPEINNSIWDIEIPEDSYDSSSINLYHWFKDKNNDILNYRCEGQIHIKVTIYKLNGTVILIPEKDWNGQENLTFFASDTISEIFDMITVTVTPVNDPPGPAKIIEPKNGIEIDDNKSLEFKALCDDPDIKYGDKLTFLWRSNISDEIGIGNVLSNISLSIGYHMITLVVSDLEGETSLAVVYISVLETLDSDSDNDGIPNIWERKHGFDIYNATDANMDFDNDGLSNIEEYYEGTDPQLPDTDNDGILDGFEINNLKTNASDADTDNDGYNDNVDVYPLDSTKWEKEPAKQEKGKEKTDLSWLWYWIIIIIVIIVLVLMFILFKKANKAGKRTMIETGKEEPIIQKDVQTSQTTQLIQPDKQPQALPLTINQQIQPNLCPNCSLEMAYYPQLDGYCCLWCHK